MKNGKQVVVGAGQTGRLLAQLLAGEGHAVTVVHRGNARRAAPLPGVTWMRGDARDGAFMDDACAGASVVYSCVSPPDYGRWDGVIQPLFRGVWAAAARARARLVQLDNLYMYGRPAAVPFDEETPEQPASSRGELRGRLAEELLAMHRSGSLEVTIGRASDFIGPDLPNTTVFRPSTLATLKRGGRVFVPGNPDVPHAYAWVGDVARALAVLGRHPAAPGRVWFLPAAATCSTRALLERMAETVGSRVAVKGLPTWLFRAAGLLSPLMRAMGEMNHLFEVPFVPDHGAFCRAFEFRPTPLSDVIAATLGLPASDAVPFVPANCSTTSMEAR